MKKRPERSGPITTSARDLIVSCFDRMISECGYEAITVPNLAESSGFSHATFYEHFATKADVLIASIEDALIASITPLLEVVADCVSTEEVPLLLEASLGDIWARRGLVIALLGGESRFALARYHLDFIRSRIWFGHSTAVPSQLAASGVAAMQLAIIESWLRESAPGAPANLARVLHASTRSAAAALLDPIAA